MKYSIHDPESDNRVAVVEVEETAGTERWEVELLEARGGARKTVFDGAVIEVADGMLEARLRVPEGARVVLPLQSHDASGVVFVATALGNIRIRAMRGAAHDAAGAGRGGAKALKSSMPGKVLKILCKTGDLVEKGQPLLVIEAMKMENEIRSTQSGRIEEIGVQAGQTVSTGDLLVKIGAGEKA